MNNGNTAMLIGDRVSFRGVIYSLSGIDGDVALLTAAGELPVAIKVASLFADHSFEMLDSTPLRRRINGPSTLFDSLPADGQAKARWWEGHVTEVLDGMPRNAVQGQIPRHDYDVRTRSLRQRELTKHAELLASGEDPSFNKLQRLVRAYLNQGILGFVGRLTEGRHATGSARTRRTLAQQPPGPFGAVYPVRPGELMQIDSTPLDIAVELDDGVIGRVELTAMVDIATRSLHCSVRLALPVDDIHR
ncbi:hypothetical protein [Arthrobacter glacialis]|uniref:hypothetical protein n=1 Tax=Arthrobacter glacialis TaxID=1664 RepID=UPI001A9D0B7B|nr:hypothetical protein [Arthrobacter glacialis]